MAASGIPLVRLPGTDLVWHTPRRGGRRNQQALVCQEENSLSHKSKMNKAAERQTVQSPGEGPGRMACLAPPPAEEENARGAWGP